VIIQSGHRTTPILKVAADTGEQADHRKKHLVNAIFKWLSVHMRGRRRTPPLTGRIDTVTDDSENRTRVRAKMRVAEIPKHSRREMKKAS